MVVGFLGKRCGSRAKGLLQAIWSVHPLDLHLDRSDEPFSLNDRVRNRLCLQKELAFLLITCHWEPHSSAFGAVSPEHHVF